MNDNNNEDGEEDDDIVENHSHNNTVSSFSCDLGLDAKMRQLSCTSSYAEKTSVGRLVLPTRVLVQFYLPGNFIRTYIRTLIGTFVWVLDVMIHDRDPADVTRSDCETDMTSLQG